MIPISVPTTSALPLSVSQPFGSSAFGLGLTTGENDYMDLDGGEVRISALDDGALNGKGKRKAAEDLDDRTASKARTLGGDRVREAAVARPLSNRALVVCGRRALTSLADSSRRSW